MLFSDQRKHSLSVPAKDDKGNAVTVGWLVHHLCEEVMKDTRKEMFVLDGHVYVSYSYSPLLNVSLLSNQCLPHFNISGSIDACTISWSRLIRSRTCSPSWLGLPFLIVPPIPQRLSLRVAAAFTDNSHLHYSRPGILVLINDADWELEGEASYALQPNDNILFVSTLHGG